MVQFDVNMKLSLSNSLCTDVPPPSEKISFIVLGPCSSSGIGLEGRSIVGTRAGKSCIVGNVRGRDLFLLKNQLPIKTLHIDHVQ